ncbi:hypothetical protein GQ53DRAFT_753587 [Thozetella sp. PMI_491]|nr:hypothetical protein GQ53DRAFT_753587 [Thozetella sp. PMI_491]
MQVFELPANIRNAPSQSVKFLWTGSFYSWEWQNHKQTNLRLLPGVDATLEAAHGLAFNVNGHCQSLFQVYFGNKDLFEASNEFQNLDPAQRLALLIWYFSSILDDFIAQCKPALALVNPAINKSKYEATEQEKRLQQVTTLHNSIVAYHRALPSTWDFKTKSLKNTIPTEPMTELLAQVYLWVEEQARMKSGQSITSLSK